VGADHHVDLLLLRAGRLVKDRDGALLALLIRHILAAECSVDGVENPTDEVKVKR